MNTQPQHNQQKPRSLSPRFLSSSKESKGRHISLRSLSPRFLSLSKESKGRLLLLFSLVLLAGTTFAQGASQAHVVVGGNIFGGGNLAPVTGNTEVRMAQQYATVALDVYGGGALADVGTLATNETAATTHTVTITEGTVGGNVYGGGLGDDTHAAAVNGVVTVNIGELIGELDGDFAPSGSVYGNATFNGSVYGCNNANGTPKDNVTVNIFKTDHIESNEVDYQGSDSTFAINQVFGGGNQAHYEPITTGKKATVHVWTCDNTIQYVYGGGNAANVGSNEVPVGDEQGGRPIIEGIASATDVIIDGGRIGWVFGGGNGAGESNPGAHIFGNTSVTFHAGDVEYFFGGSNEKGRITGQKTISIPNDNQACVEDHDNHITELYGGNNLASADGDIALTMPCTNTPCKIDYIYGGSRNADVGTAEAPANIVLTIAGGLYDYVFAGNNQGGTIYGDVTLNLFGGTINEAAFGGNNAGGDINGKITVNMLQQGCPLVVHNIYGGGNEAAYTPTFTLPEGTTVHRYPEVNLIHGTVSKKSDNSGGNVYGGGLGSTATVNASTVVNVGYDPSMADLVTSLLPAETTFSTSTVNVAGNVFGGGEAAEVTGGTIIIINKVSPTQNGSATTIVGDDVYGGGALANTGGSNVTLNGGTIGGDLYGGGLGRVAVEDDESTTDVDESVTAVAAQVTGPVQVTVNGGTVTGSVYGCNNVYGAPQSTVKVDIYGTDPVTGSGYALSNVFGGGNMAEYSGTPEVTIHKGNNCDNSIEKVYGGGNKAQVGATNVKVYGGTIGELYGGGNGDASLADNYNMVLGNVADTIYGGIIGKVFGTNNTKGLVGGTDNRNSVYIDKQPEVVGGAACDMMIDEVYGGGNHANGKACIITIGYTGNLETLGANEHYGIDEEGIQYVYGGANEADITNNINLNINSGIVENVFGGNNTAGSINGSITVNINDTITVCSDCWYVGTVYGGGNHAAYSGTPNVNIMAGTVSGQVFGGGNDITTANAGVAGSNVEMTGGTVLGGVYGGCNLNGYVTGNSVVNILGGTLGAASSGTQGDPGYVPTTHADVFGGGLGVNTGVNGNVTVTISTAEGADAPAAPTIYGDVYGGSALGNVNTDGNNTTTVNILDGTLVADVTEQVLGNGQTVYFYSGGNVFGGGLGRKAVNEVTDPETGEIVTPAVTEIEAKVFGAVTVNIGNGTHGTTEEYDGSNFTGNATIGGNVYGGNNTNGSPQDDVTVNVYRTAHTQGVNEVDDGGYAIANVFGGGNEADYAPEDGADNTTKKATVNIHGCYNTIKRVFGGGNAAATPGVQTDVQGGHFSQIFGGGNGERGPQYAANINGNLDLAIHGGNVGQFYGISNQNGNVSGDANVVTDNNGPCGPMEIDEFFCGGNFADVTGNLITTITCSEGLTVRSLYGGCNQAKIYGNVVLNVEGGTFTYVYGGSKGVAGENGISADILDNPTTDNVKEGNVTLNLYGGTIENVFGGCNVKGNIEGVITVNVIDKEGDCPLYITNIYGGSNLADYAPFYTVAEGEARISPVVNIVHAKNGISGNVYGGSKGPEVATEDETIVQAHPLVNVGYDQDMDGYITPTSDYIDEHSSLLASPRAIIAGSVFGGGDAAKVQGKTKIMLRNRAKVFGNVYGGGNMGVVTGDTKVIVNGANN